jgi:hypothetical protein
VDGAALVDDGVAFRGEGAAEGEALIELAHLAEVDQAQRFGAADGAFGGFDFAAQQAQKVVLPLPLGPTRPTFMPAVRMKLRPVKRTRGGELASG